MTKNEDETLEMAAAAWALRAPELGDWADRSLVNRRDVHGGQRVEVDGEIRRTTHHRPLTLGRLDRHFAAETTEDVIGLHATAPDETCRWVAVDIDNHPGQGADPEANLGFAREVRRRAHHAGLDSRLLDSSGGRGGFHIWVVLDAPAAMALARRLVCWLARDWEGLVPKPPDLFPGNHELTGKRCGNWLRLPGRHHKRPSWAAVWSPKRKLWRAGDGAIDALLSLRGKPADIATIVPADFVVGGRKKPGTPRSQKPKNFGPASIPPSRREAVAVPIRHGGAGGGDRELRLARVALQFHRNDDDDYDDWLAIGMALRNLADEEAAFALWDEWSAGSGKYDDNLTADKWASLRPADERGGIGLGTLFRLAMDAGWPGPAFDESEDPRGVRRRTHWSRRRGTIVVPARAIKKFK